MKREKEKKERKKKERKKDHPVPPLNEASHLLITFDKKYLQKNPLQTKVNPKKSLEKGLSAKWFEASSVSRPPNQDPS